MGRKKATEKTNGGPESAARPALSGRAAIEGLAVELYGVVHQALKEYGLTPRKQKKFFARAHRRATARRLSVELLAQMRSLSDLLTAWYEEVPYVDLVGVPQALKIEGRGATFESLARRFLPGVPLQDVVELACRTADVGTLVGGRIALYGDAMENVSRNPDRVLAQNIVHIRQIFDTCLYNAHRDPDDDKPGRQERLVTHLLSATEFTRFQGEVRGQLHDLCERLDRLLKSAAERSVRQKQPRSHAGVGLYLYYNGSTPRGTGKRARATLPSSKGRKQ